MLHLKYRPKTFEEITGHKEIIDTIKNLFFREELPHAIMLQGETGCGKTTIARIIANKLYGEITEINIANTSGIDFVRELNQSANILPIFASRKVFILDEIQMLTKEAQNCILKLLEDSPRTAYFVLCTTDPQKLIKPLRDRCTSFSLKNLSDSDILIMIKNVCEKEKIEIDSDISNLVVLNAEGCPRKALILLNQVRDIKNFEVAVKLLADDLNKENAIIDLCRLIAKKTQWKEVVRVFEGIEAEPESVRIAIAGYLAACLKKADRPEKFGQMLELFLTPLAYGTQKSEILYLLFRIYMLY